MRYIFIITCLLFLNGCFYMDEDFRREPDLVKKAGGTIIALERWYRKPNNKNSKHLGGGTEYYGAAAEKYRDNYIIKWISQFTGEEIPASNLYKVKRSNKYWRQNQTKEQYMERKKQHYESNLEHIVFIDDPMYNEFIVNNPKTGKLKFPTEKYWSSSEMTRAEYIISGKKIMETDDWEDDPGQFYYKKDEKGNFIIYDWISDVPSYKEYVIVPIKQCFSNGWCLTYKDSKGKDLYIKKEALYK